MEKVKEEERDAHSPVLSVCKTQLLRSCRLKWRTEAWQIRKTVPQFLFRWSAVEYATMTLLWSIKVGKQRKYWTYLSKNHFCFDSVFSCIQLFFSTKSYSSIILDIRCSAGLYLDLASLTCVECDFATYQVESSPEYCHPCPPNSNTTSTGTVLAPGAAQGTVCIPQGLCLSFVYPVA